MDLPRSGGGSSGGGRRANLPLPREGGQQMDLALLLVPYDSGHRGAAVAASHCWRTPSSSIHRRR